MCYCPYLSSSETGPRNKPALRRTLQRLRIDRTVNSDVYVYPHMYRYVRFTGPFAIHEG